MSRYSQVANVVEQNLIACEAEVEAWKSDHLQAMQIFRVQDLIRNMTELFHRHTTLNRVVVDNVASGSVPYNEEMETGIKSVYKRWLHLAIDIRDGLLKDCKTESYSVDDEFGFLDCISKAIQSASVDFDDYALERMDSISIPTELVNKYHSPMSQWPE